MECHIMQSHRNIWGTVVAALALTVFATTISATADGPRRPPMTTPGGICPARPHLDQGDTVSGPWGTATSLSDRVVFTVNEGYTIRICVKATAANNTQTFEGPLGPGAVIFPPNAASGRPADDISHWTLVVIGVPAATTTTTIGETPRTAPDTTTTTAPTTTPPTTTTTTTTPPTTTAAPETTTTLGETTTTTTIADQLPPGTTTTTTTIADQLPPGTTTTTTTTVVDTTTTTTTTIVDQLPPETTTSVADTTTTTTTTIVDQLPPATTTTTVADTTVPPTTTLPPMITTTTVHQLVPTTTLPPPVRQLPRSGGGSPSALYVGLLFVGGGLLLRRAIRH
jgi:hypothetical protein